MIALVRAEWTRLRSTKVLFAMAGGVIAAVVLSIAATIGNPEGLAPGVELASSDGIRTVLGGASSAAQLVLLLAIIGTAGEFRHGTISQTFLATPRRTRVVAAKIAAFAIVGLSLGTLAAATALAIAVPWLGAAGIDVSVLTAPVAHAVGGAILVATLYGVLGVGIGAAIPRQTLAIAASLLWLLVVDGLLVTLLPDVGRWLPGGAAAAMTGTGAVGARALPFWLAVAVVAAYAGAVSVLGARSITGRDIT